MKSIKTLEVEYVSKALQGKVTAKDDEELDNTFIELCKAYEKAGQVVDWNQVNKTIGPTV